MYMLPTVSYRDPFYAKFQQIMKASGNSFHVIMNQLRDAVAYDTQASVLKRELTVVRNHADPFPHISALRYFAICRAFATVYTSALMDIFSRVQLCITSRFMNTDQVLKISSLQRQMKSSATRSAHGASYADDIQATQAENLAGELESANLDFLDIPYHYHIHTMYRVLCAYVYDAVRACTVPDLQLSQLLHACDADWLQQSVSLQQVHDLVAVLRRRLEDQFLFARQTSSLALPTAASSSPSSPAAPWYIRTLQSFVADCDAGTGCTSVFAIYNHSLRRPSTADSYIVQADPNVLQDTVTQFHTVFHLQAGEDLSVSRFLHQES
uniref:Arginine--tRNA ligase n=1 Tax=Lygus hesperus TaxID=30085 RepID=A0A0A9Z8A9_LYGHE